MAVARIGDESDDGDRRGLDKWSARRRGGAHAGRRGPNPEFPPAQDALGLADLVIESVDELTSDSILSAAGR